MVLPPQVYYVDDPAQPDRAVIGSLRSRGVVTTELSTYRDLLEVTSDIEGCVLLRLANPGMHGFSPLVEVLAKWPTIPVIVLTRYGEVSSAVEAIRLGASDFLQIPLGQDDLIEALACAWANRARP